MVAGAWTTLEGKLDPNVHSPASAGADTGEVGPLRGKAKGSPASAGGPGDSKYLTRGVIPGAKTVKDLKALVGAAQ
eukprot:10040437-Lingulodinium_polyedra.AAC.1